MTFNSWEFLIFYPIVAVLYFLLPRFMRWPMLLMASYFFYAFYQPQLLFLIILTTAVSWGASRLIERAHSRAARRILLAVTMVVCLGVLFFYKYFNFLSDSFVGIAAMLGAEIPPLVLDLVLPVGISFYTFQTMSYVIDVYRGDVAAEKNPFFYALFVSFFPQLVAGPIERPDNLIPQLREEHRFNRDDAVKGAKHMLVGFFKKVCVADMISVYVDSVYNDAAAATGLGVIIATVLFAVQIYCDFSGYTDIAIGCARIMGIRLMKNFDHPYEATSVKEFWDRWHISLSGWFRDYLYIPLGGNRCAKWRYLLNLMIVFTVSGLWHGANWTYVIWGMLHGVYRIVGALTYKARNILAERVGFSVSHPAVVWVRRVLTFLLVCFAWLFFRANTVADAFVLIGKIFTSFGGFGATLELMGLGVVSILLTVCSVVVLLVIDHMLTYDGKGDGSDALVQNGAFVYFVWIILFVWTLMLSKNMQSTFIYFQF